MRKILEAVVILPFGLTGSTGDPLNLLQELRGPEFSLLVLHIHDQDLLPGPLEMLHPSDFTLFIK